MNKIEKMAEKLTSGQTWIIDDSADFLQALKIFRKKYGRKSIIPCDDFTSKGFIVILEEYSSTQNEEAAFVKNPSLGWRAYCEEHNLSLEDFNALIIGRREVEKRQRHLRFMKAKDKFISKCNSLYHRSSIKNKEKLIKQIKDSRLIF